MRRVTVTGETLTADAVARLRERGLEVVRVPGDLDEYGLVQALKGSWAYVLGGSEYASRAVLQAVAPSLEVICFLGTGYQSFIDYQAAVESGVHVAYTPHANARAVAEMTVGLMLALARNIPQLNQDTKCGLWSENASTSLVGQTLGVIGMGHIGQAVADIATSGFGMRVLFQNRTPRPEVAERLGASQVSLETLLAESDVVSLHCNYVPETQGILGAERLSRMRRSALLINTARASLVDPLALRNALAAGSLRAAFDGYYVEPVPEPDDDPYGLMGLPNSVFLLTPHVAYLTIEAMAAMSAMAAENLVAAAEGRVPPYLAR